MKILFQGDSITDAGRTSNDLLILKPSNLYIIGDSLADTYSDINYPMQG